MDCRAWGDVTPPLRELGRQTPEAAAAIVKGDTNEGELHIRFISAHPILPQ